MDPSGSNGSSPNADGDHVKNDGRPSEDDDSKKGQPGSSRPGISNQNQQAGAIRKGPMNTPTGAAAPVWRPIPTVNQVANQMQSRMPAKPRMPVGSPNQGLAAVSGAAPPAAWANAGPGYFPSPRGPQPRFQVGNNQGMPQPAMNQFVGQQSSNMMPNNGMQGGYIPRNMVSQTGMGSQDQLSKTNLYIRGLPPTTTDRALYELCCGYGNINSTKAIIDKMTNQCKGYGFVDFDNPQSADRAQKDLTNRGMLVQMAKVRSPQDQMQVQQDADPTNLYLANLPAFMAEQDLEAMLQQYGRVVSTRVLRDMAHQSRGVGFARMESKEVCDKVIEILNGKILTGSAEPLVVKFADSGNRRRQMHRERGGWQRMDGQRMGMGGYGMDGGQNGLPGSMMGGIRYSVPQAATLAGYQAGWQAPYTILPQQMMQGVEGGYSISQLAAQMSQLGLSSPYNPSPYSQQYYNPQMFPQGMAPMGAGPGGAGSGDEQQAEGGMPPGHAGVNQPPQGQYGGYQQQKPQLFVKS